MRIPELLNDDLYVGCLQSLGRDLSPTLVKAARKVGFYLEQVNIPIFRLDVEGKYQPIGLFATGHIVTEGGKKTLYVQPQTLISHAEELLVILQITPGNAYEAKRLTEYCVLQSMVHLTLQATDSLDDDSREKVFDQFTKDNY